MGKMTLQQMITQLYDYYMKHVDKLPMEYVLLIVNTGEKKSRVVCDYIAGMSDQYSVAKFQQIYEPGFWKMW